MSCSNGGSPLIRRNSFTGNARGVRCVGSGALIVSNTFVGNSSADIMNSGSPGPLVGGSLAAANDFLEPGTRAIANYDSLPLAAEYNYWGDDCVDPSWFTGSVDYTPWTDETHTVAFNDCGTGVPDGELPLAAYASPSFPNPSSRGTSIAFGLPGSGGAVSLRIYDVSGRLVRTLVDGSLPAGNHVANWDGRDERGARVSSGVYFYRLQAPGFEGQGRMVVLK